MILLLLSCADAPVPAETGTAPDAVLPDAPPLVALDAPRLLRRLSLDLRGVLPTIEELDAVESDPGQITAYRDEWLDDPRLQDRIVELLGEQWHTRIDTFNIGHIDYNLDNDQEYALERAVGEEPLRLAAHIATTDAPWSELVTADYTLANELLLSVWPLEAVDAGAVGWQLARYTDGRPPSGVLVSNGLWWRYWTTNFNYNRSRAAVMMRILVCEDLLQREVSFADVPALADADGTEVAIREAPACVNCHSVIDPAAATLFGFWWYDLYDTAEMTRYHPEREPLYETYLSEVTPAWMGQPVSGLGGLGEAIADDPRFSRCAVETFAEGLWRRESVLSDFAWLDALHDGFIDNDQNIRPLIAAITDTPTYQAGGLAEDAGEAGDHEILLRQLSPTLLASAVADLTGFSWTWNGDQRMDEDERGFRIMAGGVDGLQVIAPQADPGLTSLLVTRQLAEAAAQTGAGALFDDTLTIGDAVFDAQLESLHWRLYGVRATTQTVSELGALWMELADAGTSQAWIGVVATMLQDPLFVTR